MSEMFTPYFFSSQIEEKHPKNTQVQKERSSMLKTSKTAGTMYILFALSYKNALRITFDLFDVGMNTEKSPFCLVQSQIYIQSRIYACNFLSAMKV